MECFGVIRSTVILFGILGIGPLGFAQQEHGGEKKAQEQQRPQAAQQHQQQAQRPQQHQQQARPAQQQAQRAQQHQQQARPAQQQQAQRAQQHQQQGRPAQQQPQRAQVQRTQQQQVAQQSEQRGDWQHYRAHNWASEHRTWIQRGGYNGYRIPDNDFRSEYGRGNWFRIYGLPFVVMGGSPRFQYGGYWFSFMDPYPEYWGTSWYENDDVYVDYVNDGYYLFNRRYPGRPGISISVSL